MDREEALMPTYYPGPDVLITSEVLVVMGSRPILFRIEDLIRPYVARWDRHPSGTHTAGIYQLRATYGTQDVCLYGTDNRLKFGQVRRALVRAMEYQRDWTEPTALRAG
jgi:hypothetical protein